MLEITTLGNFELHRDGQPLQLVSRRAEALLVYLARCVTPQARLHLAELFWPERTEKQSLANLRTLLTRLRPELGEHLVVSRDTVTLAISFYRLDANVFEQTLSEFKLDNPLAGTYGVQITTLQTAAQSYKGSFLANFSSGISQDFEEWLAGEQDKLQRTVGMVFERLAGFAAHREDFPAALNWLNRLLQLDPFDEKVHRQILKILVLKGQRSTALEHYSAYRQRLFRELDIAPEAVTTDLYEAIRAGDQEMCLFEEGNPPAPVRLEWAAPGLLQRIDQLKRVSLFNGTPPDILRQLAEMLQEERHQPDTLIFEKGQLGNCMYIIIEGRVRIHDGSHTLNRLGGRDIFGEMALLDASPRMASATTMTPTWLWRLDQQTLYTLMERRIEVAQGIIRVLLGWVRERASEVVQLQAQLQTVNGQDSKGIRRDG